MMIATRHSPSATPAEVGALAAQMAREAAATPDGRMQALAALAPHWRMAVGEDRRVASSGRFWRELTGAAYVDALGRWAQSVAFVREPLAVGEVVCAPWRTAAYQAGDCDDLACAVAAFAAVVGLPAAVAVVATGPGAAHAIALVGDSWLPHDHGRLTHMIDHSGAKVAPADILERAAIFPVSVGK